MKFNLNRSDFRAYVLGRGTALESLKALAIELDVADVIEFTGRIPFEEVPSYIASFDVCMTPDPSNPYNDSCTTIKTMEYMALCKPTVCFRTHENVVTAGDAALYAEDNSVESFARLTTQLMDDASLRERMGTIARQRIEAGLTWRHQAVELIRLYQDLFDIPPSQMKHSGEALGVQQDHKTITRAADFTA